jgi:hypothetical protein
MPSTLNDCVVNDEKLLSLDCRVDWKFLIALSEFLLSDEEEDRIFAEAFLLKVWGLTRESIIAVDFERLNYTQKRLIAELER